MELLNLVQGSPEWIEARLKFKCASEAPAVMNESKFMTRNQLLDLKKGWLSNPNSSFKEKLFEKGHEHEDQGREILELEQCEDFPASVGLLDNQYLASFDGLGGDIGVYLPWEHKDWNLILAENVRNGVLEALYYWQLEHQMLVADCTEIMFTCSDGTEENRVSMIYKSVPERRIALIAAWKQFDIDLLTHEIEAKQEVIVAQKAKSLPLITFEVAGTEITSNVQQVLIEITERAEIEMKRELETDQDFADKDNLNKATKATREKFKQIVEDVQNKFVSYSEFAGVAAEIDVVLQKMQSQGEKQVKAAKIAKKKAIEDGGALAVSEHIQTVNAAINPIMLSSLMNCSIDFASAMKNKRTIESLVNAVDGVVAEFKVEANEIQTKVITNLSTLRELAGEYEFLFMDSLELVKKDNEDLVAVIKNRIAEHKTAEEEKLAEQRETIRLEEEAKAENKIKGQNLVKSWQDAFNSIKINDSVEFVQAKFDWISSSNCDEKIFTDNFDEALDIYDNCYCGISDRLVLLKKQAAANLHQEQAEAPAEVKIDNAKPYVASVEDNVETPVKARLASRFAEPSQDKPEKSIHEKMNILMYALTKSCARTSFDEFLSDWELTSEDYEQIKSFMAEKLGGMNTYL